MKKIITREEYLQNSSALFWDYHAQFLTPASVNYVREAIGNDRILESRDPFFDDIPIKEWDYLQMFKVINLNLWISQNRLKDSPASYWCSDSDNVCLGKAAAYLIKKENENDDTH